jgi:hypothetical protein
MTGLSTKTRAASVAIFVGVLGGALSLWLFRGDDAREFGRLREGAICVLDLPAGSPSASATFTTTRPVAMFYVGVKTARGREPLSILISGDHGVVASASGMAARMFGLGRGIPPGTYTVIVRQEAEGRGGLVVISGERPVYLTGWQIWSRIYVGLFALSAMAMLLSRGAAGTRVRAISFTAFHCLLLGLVLIFTYLLFHEGGHSLQELALGRFDLARSDFWGIHGHPHSGGIAGPPLEPWQQALISCAGPMLPTFVGFAMFLLWSLPIGQKLRRSRPIINLYWSALVATLVLAQAVVGPAYLLGLMTAEGDLLGYVAGAGGPVWLVKGLLWMMFLLSAFVLWRVAPELRRGWTAQFLELWRSRSDALQP